MKSQITLQDIAKEVGVSVMAVSLALRNSPRISAERRKQIQQMARELGYCPNPLVSALITSRGRGHIPDITTIACFDSFNESIDLDLASYRPWKLIAKGIEERARELGFKAERFQAALYDFNNARINQVLKSRGIRGIIFLGGKLDWDPILEWEYFACVKTVSFYPKVNLHLVHGNPVAMIKIALDKLTGYGYTKIGLAVSEATNNVTDNMVTGTFFNYQSKIPAKQRVPVFSPFSLDEKHRVKGALCQWYRRHHPDAIISHSAEFNYQSELVPFGVKVPDDVAWANYYLLIPDGKTAGMLINTKESGHAAVNLLVQQLYFNNYGLPGIPLKVMISGMEWVDGATVPVKKH